ncbi:transposase (plasmid) [Pseudonocardia bannensis]|uniref:Transposase IS204/IS1001/IS1096/IS1165 DDE domain-containing protein n=1 Tax=Pseudonocardia bannensis TaxID=630973 RepID=A0A848DJZ5_9PSEU|nr:MULTISPECIES: transposase [Pseudonocardia]NMH93037.1 hypothetical protein [Pseudonocardia bannensis]
MAGRSVVIELRVRRLACDNADCPQLSFREQVPALAARYARRTQRLTATLTQLAITLAGRAGAAALAGPGIATSRSTMLRVLMALPIPPAPTPRVLAVDDVALRRRHRYATVVIDAVTHRRVDVLPDRKAAILAQWLREHSGVEIVCRDGSASYPEAIRQGAPAAVQGAASAAGADPRLSRGPPGRHDGRASEPRWIRRGLPHPRPGRRPLTTIPEPP